MKLHTRSSKISENIPGVSLAAQPLITISPGVGADAVETPVSQPSLNRNGSMVHAAEVKSHSQGSNENSPDALPGQTPLVIPDGHKLIHIMLHGLA